MVSVRANGSLYELGWFFAIEVRQRRSLILTHVAVNKYAIIATGIKRGMNPFKDRKWYV